MRYQEAFDIYRTYTGLTQSELNYRHVQLTEAHKKIQEAIDKATPKPVKYTNTGVNYCPECESSTLHNSCGNNMNFCGKCGQALKWSNVND